MGPFNAAHTWWWPKRSLPKICHTCPTMIKFGNVILYLKKAQIYI